MSVRYLEFSPELLNSLLRGGITSTCGGGYETDAPKDINIIDVKFDAWDRKIKVLVESANFQSIPEGSPIPSAVLMITQKSCKKEVI